MAKDLAIVLNNGSLNSAVISALAAQKYRLVMLNGQVMDPAGSRGRAAYDLQVAHFKPYREHTLAMPFLSAVQTSTPQAPTVPDPRYRPEMGPALMELLPLVSLASRFAAHYQAAAIYMGLRVGAGTDELARATEFGQVWNELIQLPCDQGELELMLPLLELEPWQVVDVGYQVGAPFEKTWSCTADTPEPCWACRGCRGREAAFQQSGKPDPLRVARR
ncbi:MAG: 7-cyano-7-deazaguanine synthase [Phycisphaerales bacterium]|nr:7-cyano-7-deazaguanine synthase [Phycisphaerales bacterium]